MRNRGPDPGDFSAFAAKHLPRLSEAVDDLSYLKGRGYTSRSALQLVGNRYRLNKRQRLAAGRVSASPREVADRRAKQLPAEALHGRAVWIDGFNQLILLESLLSGAFVFRGRDGAYRDLAGVHGSYKRVMQTQDAMRTIGDLLHRLGCAHCTWVLDRPVSNSGRLRERLLDLGDALHYGWEVQVVNNPDRLLMGREDVVVSSDSEILDGVGQWFNVVQYVLDAAPPAQSEHWRVLSL